MQQKYFKFFIIALAMAIILPQVAFAAWWNPASWGVWNKIFHFQHTVQKQTADWKTYTNTQYGFEIKYPPNFYIDKSVPGEDFWVGFVDKTWENQEVHNPELFISLIKTSLSAKEWLNKMGTSVNIMDNNAPSNAEYYGVNKESDIFIGKDNNLPAVQFNSSAVSGWGTFALIKNPNSGDLIQIQAHSSGLGDFSDVIYKQMLSTFKFTK